MTIAMMKSMERECLSPLDRHIGDVVRLFDEDDDFLPIDRDSEHRYLWYETHQGESRHQSKEQEVVNVEEREGLVTRF